MSRNVLVLVAHCSDFVWRATGVLALTTAGGGKATVLALSYGERGESGELWKIPNQTVENVKKIRHEEASRAAAAVGAEFVCFDFGDYPLVMDQPRMDEVVEYVRDLAPDVIVTQTDRDPFNPDHPVANVVALAARQLTSGAGVAAAFKINKPPAIYFCEPHQTELSGFVPNVFVDITGVVEQKRAAMQSMASQEYLQKYYTERMEHRANHARRVSGNAAVKYAEAYQRMLPEVVSAL
ncbi:MAG TPA: PIG-L deacetylase family protein [Candidatus Limnocylindria bacterium]|nr:PIG-L deacetylase family protein [Candidatus Limnocylindria bacterium]